MVQPTIDSARRITLDAQLARAARQTPSTIAFKFATESRSYRQLDDRVTRLANYFRERGIRKGDRIAVMMHNRLETVEAYLASIRAGAICVPINFRLLPDEANYIVKQAGASIVIADEATVNVLAQPSFGATDARLLLVGASSAPGEPELFEDWIASGSADPLESQANDHDPAFIMYTSGTTGRPKGAILTHMNLIINTANMISAIEIMRSDRRWLAGLPLFHIGALNGILPFLYTGGTSVILPTGNFDAAAVVDILEQERITSCFFVPTQWQAICAVPDIQRRSLCLQRISWGASIAPAQIVQAIHETFPGVRTYNVFGQTEMSSITCVMRVDEAPEKIGAIGKPVPDLEVKNVGEDMRPVAVGEAGEIIYRGPTVMLGYWNMPDETAQAFEGEWFHSGDLVKQDEDGYYYVVDRKTDMIISGGENIYCPEVEAVIQKHPAVREVAVIGLPHPTWVETPVAVVCLEDECTADEGEIIQWCREKIASYKKPTRVLFVDSLPRNASGKVLKAQLKEIFGLSALR